MSFEKKLLAAAIVLVFPALAHAEEPYRLPDVVVTAPMMEEPLKVTTDPKQPRQPVPAHDGADYLKTIPGFTVIRKGGTDGDPVLRGMAGSRLNILLDGEAILGGCGNRMDPPTAYVFPESYDRITVLKGPQTVLYGPGSSAGTVLFERDIKRFREAGVKFNGSVMGGSYGRHDEVADIRAGNGNAYVQAVGTNSHSDDYEDGNGDKVHSRYTRWSANAAVGWTPDDNTRLELSGANSDGEAAYADRTMDGVKFKRENYGVKFEKSKISSLVEKVEAQAYHNYVDHVMDNYTLRSLATGTNKMVSNPDRTTDGGRASITLNIASASKLTFGADTQRNIHTLRSTMNQATMPYEARSRTEDANFLNYGLFGELTHQATDRDKIIAGLRSDHWRAEDKRATVTLTSTAGATSNKANPSQGQVRETDLTSGFARWERDLASLPATFYAGLGHSERFPDYWELISANKESAATISAFDTKPEKNNQLDVGLIYQSGPLSASVSGFYNKINDYILLQSNVRKTDLAVVRNATIVRNVDATTWGGEAGIGYALSQTWKVNGSLAYVHGDNDTDGTALGQMPPLEMRLSASYDNKVWSAGALWRLVARQNRVDPNKGNIVGQDIGETGGFGVFSLNAGYRPKKGVLLSGGIDNLFDKTYAEHLSRGESAIAGFSTSTRVNELGRFLWVKANIAFD